MENFETASPIKPILPPPHERLMAALAHLSAFVPWFGWLISLTFWFANRGEARYVAFQAKQACVFQIFMGFVGFASWFSSMILLRSAYRGMFLSNMNFMKQYPWFFLPLMLLITFTLSYGVVGAIYCAWGLPFRYRFIWLWLKEE